MHRASRHEKHGIMMISSCAIVIKWFRE